MKKHNKSQHNSNNKNTPTRQNVYNKIQANDEIFGQIQDWSRYLTLRRKMQQGSELKTTIEVPYVKNSIIGKGINAQGNIFERIIKFDSMKVDNYDAKSIDRISLISDKKDLVEELIFWFTEQTSYYPLEITGN